MNTENIVIIFTSILLLSFSTIALILIYINNSKRPLPQPFERGTKTSKHSYIDIVKKFFLDFKVNIFNIEYSDKNIQAFKNESKDSFQISFCSLKTKHNQINAFELDYILYRSFLSHKKRTDGNGYFVYKLMLHWLPSILYYLLILLTLIDVTFHFYAIFNRSEIEKILFLNNIYIHKILFIINIFIFLLHIIVIGFNPKFKNLLDNEYEMTVLKYVKDNYNDFYNDFIQVRKYCRIIKFTMNFGMSSFFNNNQYNSPIGK